MWRSKNKFCVEKTPLTFKNQRVFKILVKVNQEFPIGKRKTN